MVMVKLVIIAIALAILGYAVYSFVNTSRVDAPSPSGSGILTAPAGEASQGVDNLQDKNLEGLDKAEQIRNQY